jgi:prevent-host-death family protein
MREIGVFEAKNKLASLIHQVELGAEILITRRGLPVAKLVAVYEKPNKDKAKIAANNVRGRAKALKLGRFRWSEWKKYRDKDRCN